MDVSGVFSSCDAIDRKRDLSLSSSCLVTARYWPWQFGGRFVDAPLQVAIQLVDRGIGGFQFDQARLELQCRVGGARCRARPPRAIRPRRTA